MGWVVDMSLPTTLDAGGTGLGRDVSDAETKPHCIYCIMAYGENRMLNKAVLSQDQEIAALRKSCQWRTLGIAVTFIAGFLLACVLIGVTG
jgi:hypothetical protein